MFFFDFYILQNFFFSTRSITSSVSSSISNDNFALFSNRGRDHAGGDLGGVQEFCQYEYCGQ